MLSSDYCLKIVMKQARYFNIYKFTNIFFFLINFYYVFNFDLLDKQAAKKKKIDFDVSISGSFVVSLNENNCFYAFSNSLN